MVKKVEIVSYENSTPIYLIEIDRRARLDEVSIRDFWNTLWKRKKVITGITLVFSVSTIVIASFLPDIYRSEVLLATSRDTQGRELSVESNQFGNLANLSGIGFSSHSLDRTDNALAILRSRIFIKSFICKLWY